jgi:hypothetical protein
MLLSLGHYSLVGGSSELIRSRVGMAITLQLGSRVAELQGDASFEGIRQRLRSRASAAKLTVLVPGIAQGGVCLYGESM